MSEESESVTFDKDLPPVGGFGDGDDLNCRGKLSRSDINRNNYKQPRQQFNELFDDSLTGLCIMP